MQVQVQSGRAFAWRWPGGAIVLFMALSCARFNAPPAAESYVLLNQLLDTASGNSSVCSSMQAGSVLVTTSKSPDTVTASWSIPSGCSVQSVVVVRNTTIPASSSDGTPISGATSTSFTDTTVLSGTLYYYGIYLNGGPVRLISALVGTTSFQPGSVAAGSLTVDGYDNETVWSSMPKVSYSFAQSPDTSAGQDLTVSGYVRLGYDSNNLYIYYKRYDKYVVVNNSTGNPWIDDSVELFFDMNYDRASLPRTDDFQLILAPLSGHWFHGKGNGTGYSTSWIPAMGEAIVVTGDRTGGAGSVCTSTSNDGGSPAKLTCSENSDTDATWQIELKIPFSELGMSSGSITTGKVIGFTFSNNEDDQTDTGNQHSYPYTSGSVYNNPGTWGILQF